MAVFSLLRLFYFIVYDILLIFVKVCSQPKTIPQFRLSILFLLMESIHNFLTKFVQAFSPCRLKIGISTSHLNGVGSACPIVLKPLRYPFFSQLVFLLIINHFGDLLSLFIKHRSSPFLADGLFVLGLPIYAMDFEPTFFGEGYFSGVEFASGRVLLPCAGHFLARHQ